MSVTRTFGTFGFRGRMPTLLFALLLAPIAAARCAPPRDDVARVELQNCTVDLIDHAVLASDRNGVLANSPTEEGHRVDEGTVVARLRDDVARAQLEIALAEARNDFAVKVAALTKDVADTEYRHMKELLAKNAETEYRARRSELIAAREGLSLKQARHELSVAALRLEEAKARLREYRITAPFDGTVVRRFKSAGEAVQQGDPVLEVASTRRLKVEGYVSSMECRGIERGMPVEVVFEMANGKEPRSVTLKGSIQFVGLTVVPVSGKVRVWAEIDNSEEVLWPGTECTMRILAPPATREHVVKGSS